MKINNKYTLTYCSNIFKVNNIKKLINNINNYLIYINKNNKKKIGINICISNNLSNKIKKDKNIIIFKKWQENKNSYISSINGFVYSDFHKKKIKENIYYPDWSSEKRKIFTNKLIVIASKISNRKEISISTLPISYKKWINKNDSKYLLYKSALNIIDLINKLVKIKKYLKKIIHLDIEPEPLCVIENYNDFIFFYKKWLTKLYENKFTLKKHIRLCYDVCHFSVLFENHEKILKKIKNENILIGKIQISSALETYIHDNSEIKFLKKTLFLLNKSNFLHQCILKKNNKIEKYNDINNLINVIKTKKNYELRIHCHIPIYKKKFKYMNTTYEELKKFIFLIKNINISKNIEIETYTHNLFYKIKKCNKSILNEYNFIINTFKND